MTLDSVHGVREGRYWWPLTLLLLAAGIAARLVHLDADPYFSTWLGYVMDEGRWVETARNVALFRTVEFYSLSQLHLALSPGFQAATLAAFEAFGVQFWSARLVPALAGVALLGLVAVGLRRTLHPAAIAFGIAVLAFEHQFLFLSRVALPEIPSLLFAACAFALTVAPGCTPRRALLAGFSATVAVAMKGTSVFVMPVFGVLMAFDPGADTRARVRNVAAFSLAFGGPMFIGLIGLLALGLGGGASSGSVANTLFGFLKPAGLWRLAWRIHDGDFLLPSYVALLGAWLGSFASFSRAALATSLPHRVLVFAAVWCAWWAAVWIPLEYLPERYVVHLQFPALLCGTAGLSLALRSGLPSFPRIVRPHLRLALGMWLVLPSALLLAPVLVALSGADVTRTAVPVVAFAVALAVLGGVAAASLERRAFVAAAYVFAPAALAAWLATGVAAESFPRFWPTVAHAPQPELVFALMIAAGVSVAAACVEHRRVTRFTWALRAVAAGGAIAVVAMLASISLPHLLQPRYTMRTEANRLATELAGAREVFAGTSASLLIPTRLRNRAELTPGRRVDAAVLFAWRQDSCCLPIPAPFNRLGFVDRRALRLEWIPPNPAWGPAQLVVLRAALD